MKKIKKLFSPKRIMSSLLAVTMVLGMTISASAAGSKQLNVNDDEYRFYAECFYNSDANKTAGIPRQTITYTYVNPGETIYFGSSVADSKVDKEGNQTSGITGADIAVQKPNGEIVPFDVKADGDKKGYINSRDFEVNGPNNIYSATRDSHGDALTDSNENTLHNSSKTQNGYNAFSITADADNCGLFKIMFNSKTGERGNPTADLVNSNNAVKNQNNSDTAYWDITVADENDKEITGRTYVNYLSINSGSAANSIKSSLHIYVLTNDGYEYSVNLNGASPWGMVFFANNMGLTTMGETPYSIYHSVYDNDNNAKNLTTQEFVSMHFPFNDDTEVAKTFKIFFEKPNPDLEGKLYTPAAQPNSIESIDFRGYKAGAAYHGQGGVFSFDTLNATSATITIDFSQAIADVRSNPDCDESVKSYKGSGVVILNGAVKDGTNEFIWDGKDSAGEFIPVSVYTDSKIKVSAEPKVGEIHFPFLDVEGLSGNKTSDGKYDGVGITVERLTGTESDENPDAKYDLFYNNNPLYFGTINGKNEKKEKTGSYYNLSDGTRSYASTGNETYFDKCGLQNLSTLDYTDNLGTDEKPEYKHKAVNSSKTSMFWDCGSGSPGGGDRAIIDCWTYYSAGASVISDIKIEMQIDPAVNIGKISGRVFDDKEGNDAKFNATQGDAPLADYQVQLLAANGNPIYIDENGSFLNMAGEAYSLDDDGYVLDENKNLLLDDDGNPIKGSLFTLQTDINGAYVFYGVPYDEVSGTSYKVKVNLTDVQMLAVPTNSTNNDGNKGTNTAQLTKTNEAAAFADIGYRFSTNLKTSVTIKKEWDTKTPISETLFVEVYVVKNGVSTLVDGSRVTSSNGFQHRFYNLNKTLEYFVKEYYFDENGEKVLVGVSPKYSLNDDNNNSKEHLTGDPGESDSIYSAEYWYMEEVGSVKYINISNSRRFTETPQIVGATLYLDNEIGVNFYCDFYDGKAVKQPDGSYIAEDVDYGSASWYEMHFKLRDKKGNYLDEEGNIVSKANAYEEVRRFDKNELNFLNVNGTVKPLFRFTHWGYAFQMADIIEAQMYTRTSTGSEPVEGSKAILYSVQQYSKNMLAKSTTSANLSKTLKSLLNYGTYSQKYWNYHTDYPANSILSAPDQAAVTNLSSIDSKYAVQKTGTGDIDVNGLALGFDKGASFDLSLTVKTDAGSSIGDYSSTLSSPTIKYLLTSDLKDNIKLPFNIPNDYYSGLPTDTTHRLNLKNLPVYRWDDKFKLSFSNGFAVDFSLFSYAYNVVNEDALDEVELDDTSKENLVNLLKSMYLYNRDSQAYFVVVEQYENEHGIPDHYIPGYNL